MTARTAPVAASPTPLPPGVYDQLPGRRRVTPTAVLVSPASATRDEWLRARRGGIGSSDVAAILNLGSDPDSDNPYSTPLHVYYNKHGELPDNEDAGEAALWGTLHEDTVAREWARRNKSAIRRVGLVAQVDAPWRMCTLDRRVTVCPLNRDRTESCALEVKNRNAFVAGKWRRGTPDDVTAQTLWQGRVTGYDHVHVACLIGNADYRQFTVHLGEHAQTIEDITTAVDRLWHENIVPGRPPAASGNPEALVDLYDQLNPDRGGIARFDRDLVVFDALGEYLDACADEKDADRRKKVAKAVLIGALGSAEAGVMDDELAFTYRKAPRTVVDTELLAERWPDAHAVCVGEKSSPRLNITNQYKKKWVDCR